MEDLVRERDKLALEADRERDPAKLASLIRRVHELQMRLGELEKRTAGPESEP